MATLGIVFPHIRRGVRREDGHDCDECVRGNPEKSKFKLNVLFLSSVLWPFKKIMVLIDENVFCCLFLFKLAT